MSSIKADEAPTLPLTDKEYKKLLATVPVSFPDSKKRLRVRALIRLMRHSGLVIRDAATLRKDELIHDKRQGFYRVVTSRQKTGTHVSVPVPPDVAKELLICTQWESGLCLLDRQWRGTYCREPLAG